MDGAMIGIEDIGSSKIGDREASYYSSESNTERWGPLAAPISPHPENTFQTASKPHLNKSQSFDDRNASSWVSKNVVYQPWQRDPFLSTT